MGLRLIRKARQGLIIYTEKGTPIEVTFTALHRRRAEVVITAPREIRILRKELVERKGYRNRGKSNGV